MIFKALVCGPDEDENAKVAAGLLEHGMESELVDNGKDAQLELFNHKYFTLLIDFDTTKNHSFEVIRYANINSPIVRVILIIDSIKRLEEDFLLNVDQVKALGVLAVIEKPFTPKQLHDNIMGDKKVKFWNKKKSNEPPAKESVVKAFDDEFTHIKIEEFFAGKIAIFDIFVRLGENRYIKILNKGDNFEQERITKYQKEKNIKYLYFKNKDRIVYISMMNELLDSIKQKGSKAQKAKIKIIKNLGEKFIEESYTEGISPALVEEAAGLCKHTMDIVAGDKHYNNLIKMIEDYGGDLYSHSTAVMFVASLICYQNEWATQQSVDLISMGALLHDIGKTQLPDIIRLKEALKMTPKELVQYKDHPEMGLEQVEKMKGIPGAIRQIIMQHHENYDGSGFPKGIHGVKIFPLARIVSLADYMINYMAKTKKNLIESTNDLTENKKERIKFDPAVIQTLVECTLPQQQKKKSNGKV